MGICMTKLHLTKDRKKQAKGLSVEMPESPLTCMLDIPRFAELKEKMVLALDDLEEVQQNIENQAKSYMRNYKRGKSIFALKRLQLFTKFAADVQIQIQRLDQVIIEQGMSLTDKKKVFTEAQTLLVNVNQALQLEMPLNEGEDIKLREAKFKCLFKKYNIHIPDIYPLFAKYEAEVNDITLTTSFVFQKSDAKTQPCSHDCIDS